MSSFARKFAKALAVMTGCTLLMMVLLAIAWKSGMDPAAPRGVTASMAEATAVWAVPLQLLRCGLWSVVWWRWDWIGRRWFKADESEAATQSWHGLRPVFIASLALVEGLILLRQIG